MQKFILYFFVLFIASCNTKTSESQKIETPIHNNILALSNSQLNVIDIKTAKLEVVNMSGTIKVYGKIDVPPQNLVSMSVPLGGYLKSTHLLPGMHIAKGEVIAILEDQQYIQLQQDYLITKVKLQTSENEFLRQKDLNESKASSDKVFQIAKADYQSNKITLSALSEKLKLINVNPSNLTEDNLSKSINVYAPFDGFVSKVNVNIGKYVTPSDIIFELVNPDDIHLNLKVFEKDLIQLSIGQKVLAYTNIHPEKKYNCEILQISRDINLDKTADVHSHFDNYDKSLIPGMYMNADIKLNEQAVQTIAEKALVIFGTKKFIFIRLDKKNFELFEVKVGQTNNGLVEIENATDLIGKDIVTDGSYKLLMALKNKSEE